MGTDGALLRAGGSQGVGGELDGTDLEPSNFDRRLSVRRSVSASHRAHPFPVPVLGLFSGGALTRGSFGVPRVPPPLVGSR